APRIRRPRVRRVEGGGLCWACPDVGRPPVHGPCRKVRSPRRTAGRLHLPYGFFHCRETGRRWGHPRCRVKPAYRTGRPGMTWTMEEEQGKRMLGQEARERMKERLDQAHDWPSVYPFKFILEPEPERLNALLGLFPAESE